MTNLQNKRVLITGATAGIGLASARALAQKGADLYLVARRKEQLKTIAKELNAHAIVGDVNDPQLIQQIAEVTGEKLDVFINNAGLALGRDKVETAKWSDFEVMINTNITAAFRLVHGVLPWMLKQGSGDIINLCSIAGHYTYQGGSVYCATKHAVNAFTRVLREETAGRNLRIMQISPGMVNTEFSTVRFHGDRKAADAVYANMEPLTGEDIARMMIFMLESPRHVVIDEIITMPQAQGSPTTVVRNQ